VSTQLVWRNRDIVGGACVKNRNGKVIAEDDKVKEVWREHFDKLLNVEFSWSRHMLEHENPTCGPAENITVQEVREAIAKSKLGKAAGSSGIVAELLKASGSAGEQ